MSQMRPFEEPLPSPLAFFLTWTTYGTWLPGDERGWIKKGQGFQLADLELEKMSRWRMTETPCFLDHTQRKLVEQTIEKHCQIRSWDLHTKNCRSNHVHVVATGHINPDEMMSQFKSWCTRRLVEAITSGIDNDKQIQVRSKWWTE